MDYNQVQWSQSLVTRCSVCHVLQPMVGQLGIPLPRPKRHSDPVNVK